MRDLKFIVAIVKFTLEVDERDLTWVKDTQAKILACYLAKKLTDYSNRAIAEFFNINPQYMQKRLEETTIEFLLDNDAFRQVEMIEQLFKEFKAVAA